MEQQKSSIGPPHIVIVGGGFGGLAAARVLGDAPVRITLVDRRNHHLFQPLLYQVATAALNPGDIASPIRRILRRQANVEVILGEAESIDPSAQKVILRDGEIAYDYLIIASGATHSYFGHEAWERCARRNSSRRSSKLVSYRDPRLGPWHPFIHARGIPAWEVVSSISDHRRFKGRTFVPPFVVVRRTSRPGDKHRAVGTIISGRSSVAVENHLIVSAWAFKSKPGANITTLAHSVGFPSPCPTV
jgi:Pyridine nucleotide-disulphide oxidoreductase